MEDFFEKNKIFIAIIIGAFIIAGSIWLSNRPLSTSPPPTDEGVVTSRRPPKISQLQREPSKRISYTEAPNHIGEYACVVGKVDHVYTSRKGNTFLNFCPDYKTCPFGAVIFSSDAHKFSNPKQYEGRTVEIIGLIRSYQGRPEIILNDPSQIKIK